ncbi:MAG: flavodoxin domain-containing protein [Candidatus Shapirobacteria bacterium]
MKTVIIYQSFHHQNTQNIVKYIADKYPVKLLNISRATSDLVNRYDRIILAGGIYFGKPHRLFSEIIPKLKIKNKNIFLITTSGLVSLPLINDYHKNFKLLFNKSGLNIKSWFETRGFDTYPFFVKPFGGINKNRPNHNDLIKALKWFRSLDL